MVPLLTLGPVFAGGMVAMALSAVVGMQTFLYFRLFPHDLPRLRFTDAAHTIAVCCAVWQYAVVDFNNPEGLLVMPMSVNIPFTLIATLNATLFYTWRITKLSKRNWYIVVPILLLILYSSRHWGHFSRPPLRIAAWIISALTDIAIAGARYYYLRQLRQGYLALLADSMDAVMVFTINDGLLSCVLVMPENEIWVGFYFVFAKRQCNNQLILNMRNWFRNRERPMGINFQRPNLTNKRTAFQTTITTTTTADKVRPQSSVEGLDGSMQVFVDRQIDKFPAGQEFNLTVGHYVREPAPGMISPTNDPGGDDATAF
ncbi:hypothetical protein GGX14DRAFT_481018 [Mycena pura]|uniref:DUF6534 domain-containing protein n=1 Tax=Mycena pura TaxID=153505 RepID=A0AAD6XZ78_9AGAR|nr:hypothetical protein GGX14DRAFT_481018 [Mycena pura]